MSAIRNVLICFGVFWLSLWVAAVLARLSTATRIALLIPAVADRASRASIEKLLPTNFVSRSIYLFLTCIKDANRRGRTER